MELLQGQSLTEVIRPDGDGRPMPVERALHIVRQILRALDHAHASGVVHRDLKPDNVMLIERDGETDIVKLLDFGIAKMIALSRRWRRQERDARRRPASSSARPSICRPSRPWARRPTGAPISTRAGIVLYEMLTGRRPFEAQSKVAIVSMHLTQKAIPVTQAAPDARMPQALERIVERAMAKKRDERYASAQELLAALDEPTAVAVAPVVPASSSSDVRRSCAWRQPRNSASATARASSCAVRATPACLFRARSSPRASRWRWRSVALLFFARRTDHPTAAPGAQGDRRDDLARAELLLGRGELEPARAALTQLLSTHPEVARVRYLLGNLDNAQGEREHAIDDYHDAIRLDGAYADDAALARQRTRHARPSRRGLGRCRDLLAVRRRQAGAAPISPAASRAAATSTRAVRPPKPPSSSAASALAADGKPVRADDARSTTRREAAQRQEAAASATRRRSSSSPAATGAISTVCAPPAIAAAASLASRRSTAACVATSTPPFASGREDK